MIIEDLEFETERVRPGVFKYRVRRPAGEWVPGSDFMHGRPSDRKTKAALLHHGKLDLQRAGH